MVPAEHAYCSFAAAEGSVGSIAHWQVHRTYTAVHPSQTEATIHIRGNTKWKVELPEAVYQGCAPSYERLRHRVAQLALSMTDAALFGDLRTLSVEVTRMSFLR